MEWNPQPKPSRSVRLAQQQARRVDVRVARRRCRLSVWTREQGRCQGCAREVVLSYRASGWLAHVDEQPPRSRGGDPTDPSGCVLLCAECHIEQHRRASEYRIYPGDHGFPEQD